MEFKVLVHAFFFAVLCTYAVSAPTEFLPGKTLGTTVKKTEVDNKTLRLRDKSKSSKSSSSSGGNSEDGDDDDNDGDDGNDSSTSSESSTICLDPDTGDFSVGTKCGIKGGCCSSGFKCHDGASCRKSSLCFAASATVELESGARKTMEELALGDRVRVGPEQFSTVFLFTHANSDYRSTDFVTVRAENGRSLTASVGHFVYAAISPVLSEREVVSIDKVSPGSFVFFGGDAVRVNAVEHKVAGNGLYNPQTLHGDIVVDGFLATTYTSSLEPALAHNLLSPLRALYGLTGLDVSTVYATGADFLLPLVLPNIDPHSMKAVH